MGLGRLCIFGSALAISGASYVAYAMVILRNRKDSLQSHFIPIEERRKALEWRPPTRASLLSDLRSKEFDLLVIGGGATGTGCALDAASRGLQVALLERDDYSAGTSSKSTKLVHGGVRYLEKAFLNFDWEQFEMVREALQERSTFLRIAPHLTKQLPIMLPIYQWWKAPYYWFGSKIYDFVAGSRGLEQSYFLNRSKALEVFPMLRGASLIGAMVYYDGEQNDARTNIALALTALQQGATALNYAEVVDLLKDKEGRINGVLVKDRLTEQTFTVKSKGVISATGPFCGKPGITTNS